MPNVSTGTTMIKFGSHLRIGYRAAGSPTAFTYLPQFYQQSDLPVIFAVPSVGNWEVEYTEICPNCTGGIYSNVQVATVML